MKKNGIIIFVHICIKGQIMAKSKMHKLCVYSILRFVFVFNDDSPNWILLFTVTKSLFSLNYFI